MPPPDLTIADAWQRWLAYRCCSARPLRVSTKMDYDCTWNCHLRDRLGDMRLADVDGTMIAQLVVDLSAAGVRPKRLSNILVPLRACLRWHYRMGASGRDPTNWFDSPAAPADERKILTIEQVERLIACTPEFYRPHVTFSAYTGVRLGELCALTWDCVDLDACTALIDKNLYKGHLQRSTKTGHDRNVPLGSHLVAVLESWRPRCPASAGGWVFPRPDGDPLEPDSFRDTVWRKAVKAAGLPPTLRIHDLRHTSASLYLQHGATVREVMEIHGWRKMETALRYLHTGDTLGAAAERLSRARQESVGPGAPSSS